MAFSLRGFFTSLNTAFSNYQAKAIVDAYGYTPNGYKRVSQVYSNTTFTELTDLSLELKPGRYRITYILATPSMTGAGGIKLQLVSQGGLVASAVAMSAYYWLTATAPVITPITALSSAVNGGTTNAYTSVLVTGTIEVTQQGFLQLQAAQQAASGTTTVAVGSCVDAIQLT